MSYFESRVRADFKNFEKCKEILGIYSKLGVQNIILEPESSKIFKIPVEIKENLSNITNIQLFYRINFKTENLNEFKNKIQRYNNSTDILSVESNNKDVQIHAARDSRVDILSFSNPDILKSLTPGVLSLLKQHNTFIEYSLAPIMVSNKTLQSKNFRNLYRFLKKGIRSKVNYIISGNFNDLYDYRHPRALIGICTSLLGLTLTESRKAFKDNPKLLLEMIETKVDRNILEPGFRIIDGDNRNG